MCRGVRVERAKRFNKQCFLFSVVQNDKLKNIYNKDVFFLFVNLLVNCSILETSAPVLLCLVELSTRKEKETLHRPSKYL